MAEDKVIIKRSGTPGEIPLPSQLEFGELALNYADGRLFAKRASGAVTDLAGLPDSNNTIYVSVEGDDRNSGREPGESKRTIRAALNASEPRTTIVVGAGTFVEDTPLIMPQRTTIHGVDQRVTSVRPNTATNDIFWVSSGCYVAGMGFVGHMKPSYAVAFPGNVHVGTANGGGDGANTIVLDSSKAVQGFGLEDYYREMRITLTGGTGAGQVRNIVSYNTATRTANVDANWNISPDLTSVYYIDIAIPSAPSPNTRYSTHITASPYLYNMACVTADQFLATSTSTVSIGDGVTGSMQRSFTIQTGLTIATGRWIRCVFDAQNYFTGTVASYNSATGLLVLNIAKAIRNSQVARSNWIIYYICGSGMEIDGYKAAGLRSMVSAQFTQFNSGGDAVVIKNMGYAQLVSIYAICCEDGFLAESGGTSSMGNCNVNFGTFGLVARDVGPLLMSGRAGFIYDKTRCARDTRLIVDAIAQDLQNEGVNQSVFAGIQYWNQDSVVANSTTSLVVSTGTKTLNVAPNLSSNTIALNDYVRLVYDELNYMYGQVTAYNSVTGGLTVNATRAGEFTGNTFNSWQILGPGDNRVPENQKAATVAAIQFAGANAALKVATASEQNFVTAAFNKVADIVAFGTSDLTNQIIRNKISISASAPIIAANTALQNGKGNANTAGSIVKATLDYITATYPSLTYDSTKCARDIGYIIDCVCYDLMYNIDETYVAPSNRQTIQAGVYYYGYTTTSALQDEVAQTISAFDYLKKEIAAVLPTGANAGIRASVNTKIDVINDLINYGPTGPARFWGTITGTTLNVTSVVANTVRVGMAFYPPTGNANGYILSQSTGPSGGKGNYVLSLSQTVASNTLFLTDYTVPISFSRNTDSTLIAAGDRLDIERTAFSTNVTNYIDNTLTSQGYDNQLGFFINVSNIVACTDPRFAITSNTKPYLGLVMHIDGEKTIDIQPGPGYDPGEQVKIYARDNTVNWMIGTVQSFDLVTGLANVSITSANNIGFLSQFWESDLDPTPGKKGRFTQELTVVGSGNIEIEGWDTSKEINKYRTIVYANTVGDITFLELDERITGTLTLNGVQYPNGIPKNTRVFFYQKSALSASGQTFEFVGSGVSTAVALPRNGGDIVQANEVVSSNGGIVYFTSTDQFGNFRIGEDLTINFNTGTLSGRTFTRSLFAQITPFILAIDS